MDDWGILVVLSTDCISADEQTVSNMFLFVFIFDVEVVVDACCCTARLAQVWRMALQTSPGGTYTYIHMCIYIVYI